MTPTKRAGLLALAITFSAGIHAALVPEHLQEMPPLGYSFIAAAVIGAGIAGGLIVRPDDRRIPALAALFLVGQVLVWVLFVTVHVPGFMGTPESVETIALVCKAVELLGLAIALPLVLARRVGSRPSGAHLRDLCRGSLVALRDVWGSAAWSRRFIVVALAAVMVVVVVGAAGAGRVVAGSASAQGTPGSGAGSGPGSGPGSGSGSGSGSRSARSGSGSNSSEAGAESGSGSDAGSRGSRGRDGDSSDDAVDSGNRRRGRRGGRRRSGARAESTQAASSSD
jgi:hypothetical protein